MMRSRSRIPGRCILSGNATAALFVKVPLQSVKKVISQGSPPAAPIGVQGPKAPQYSPLPTGEEVGGGALRGAPAPKKALSTSCSGTFLQKCRLCYIDLQQQKLHHQDDHRYQQRAA